MTEWYPERNAKIRKMYFELKMTLREIAAEYGVSHQAIHIIIHPEKNSSRHRKRYGFDEAYTEKVRTKNRERAQAKRAAQLSCNS